MKALPSSADLILSGKPQYKYGFQAYHKHDSTGWTLFVTPELSMVAIDERAQAYAGGKIPLASDISNNSDSKTCIVHVAQLKAWIPRVGNVKEDILASAWPDTTYTQYYNNNRTLFYVDPHKYVVRRVVMGDTDPWSKERAAEVHKDKWAYIQKLIEKNFPDELHRFDLEKVPEPLFAPRQLDNDDEAITVVVRSKYGQPQRHTFFAQAKMIGNTLALKQKYIPNEECSLTNSNRLIILNPYIPG